MAGGALHPRYRLNDAERAMVQGTWPLGLIEDPARQPRIIETASDFIRELLIGEHLEDFIVLPNGTELLDLSWEDSMPDDLRELLRNCTSARDFAQHLRQCPAALAKYRADIEYVDKGRQQRDVLRKEKHDLGKRIDEALRMADDGLADPALLYVAEMRLKKEAPHPAGGEKVKTVCRRDVKDVLGPYAAWTLYWDRYDEGFFAGGRSSGKGVHVDQVLWSNVGRNWHGYKLVAAWPKGEVSKKVGLEFYDILFTPPLAERELQALTQAARIVFLRPGDVYLFSGGVAHTVLCVSEEMCLGAYESLVNLHPTHVRLFLHTDDRSGPYCLDKYSMSSRELKDTKDDCIDQLEDAEEQLGHGGPAATPEPARPLSAVWSGIRQQLRKDGDFQAVLRRHYGDAVELCAADRYFRRHLPRRVLGAGQACLSGSACEDGNLAAPKRQRCSSPLPFEDPPALAVGSCDQLAAADNRARSRSSSYSSDHTSGDSA